MPPLKRVVVLVEHRYGYFRDVLRGVRAYARQRQPWVLHTVDISDENIRRTLAPPPDGIVGHPGGPGTSRLIAGCGCPVVRTTRPAGETPGVHVPFVAVDDEAVGRLAAEHLLGLGLRRFAFAGPMAFAYARLRGEGFAQHLHQVCKQAPIDVYRGEVSPAREFGTLRNEREFLRWISSIPRPFGLFAATDTWAVTIAERCHEAGIAVPEQVALIGVDNDDLICESCRPSLTSIQTPAQRIGYEAARLLDELMEGEKPMRVQVPVAPIQVVARESTNALPSASRVVASAVRYIHAHSFQPLAVNEVARIAHVSRRLLEIRFRAELGRTVLAEIHKAHVDRARHLLLDTDLSMPEVAAAAGFSNPTRMGIVFRRFVGAPPAAYRRQTRISAPAS